MPASSGLDRCRSLEQEQTSITASSQKLNAAIRESQPARGTLCDTPSMTSLEPWPPQGSGSGQSDREAGPGISDAGSFTDQGGAGFEIERCRGPQLNAELRPLIDLTQSRTRNCLVVRPTTLTNSLKIECEEADSYGLRSRVSRRVVASWQLHAIEPVRTNADARAGAALRANREAGDVTSVRY